MSKDLIKAFSESASTVSAEAQYQIGARRYEDGKIQVYQKADEALTANHAVVLDVAASATGKEVTGATALNQFVYGAAEQAFTDEYHGFITRGGVASILVADGVVAGDILAPSAVAGVLAPWVPRYRMLIPGSFADGGLLTDGSTYKALIPVPFAFTVKAISAVIGTAMVGGTNTLKFLKGEGGNTLLNAASVDPTTLVADAATALTLTATAADLSFTAAQAVYAELVCGTMTTDGADFGFIIEIEPTAAVQIPCGIAMQANSTGSAAAKNVFLFRS